MAKDLVEIGHRFRDAHASSFSEGQRVSSEYFASEGYLHVHIPAAPHKQDGEWIIPKSDTAEGQADVMGRINLRVRVNKVRQLGDDLLVLETTYSATLPDGRDVSFEDVIMWTFNKDRRITRQVQVASTEMWDTLRDALQTVGAPGYAAGGEYWKDEKLNEQRHPDWLSDSVS
jgi:hypothetical protein